MSSSPSSSARTPRHPATEATHFVARLTGVTERLDPRIHAVRADLADIALAGRVIVPRYAAPDAIRCVSATAMMVVAPDDVLTAVSELLHGEDFAVFDRRGDWMWGQGLSDGYVGWVPSDCLAQRGAPPTHRITAPQALVFAAPSIKARVVATLPLGAALACSGDEGEFLHVPASGGWLHRRHIEAGTGDAVDLARAFVGTPYRWGGRTRSGIDCSGLVQAVLHARGITCPRDSDQQFAAFPAVAFDDRRRGDLVAFPGHIGILVDAGHLLHANAWSMTTLIEPLDNVVARLADRVETPVLGVVRPPCSGPALTL